MFASSSSHLSTPSHPPLPLRSLPPSPPHELWVLSSRLLWACRRRLCSLCRRWLLGPLCRSLASALWPPWLLLLFLRFVFFFLLYISFRVFSFCISGDLYVLAISGSFCFLLLSPTASSSPARSPLSLSRSSWCVRANSRALREIKGLLLLLLLLLLRWCPASLPAPSCEPSSAVRPKRRRSLARSRKGWFFGMAVVVAYTAAAAFGARAGAKAYSRNARKGRGNGMAKDRRICGSSRARGLWHIEK